MKHEHESVCTECGGGHCSCNCPVLNSSGSGSGSMLLFGRMPTVIPPLEPLIQRDTVWSTRAKLFAWWIYCRCLFNPLRDSPEEFVRVTELSSQNYIGADEKDMIAFFCQILTEGEYRPH